LLAQVVVAAGLFDQWPSLGLDRLHRLNPLDRGRGPVGDVLARC
jgi:hypothetical protein